MVESFEVPPFQDGTSASGELSMQLIRWHKNPFAYAGNQSSAVVEELWPRISEDARRAQASNRPANTVDGQGILCTSMSQCIGRFRSKTRRQKGWYDGKEEQKFLLAHFFTPS